MAKKIGLFSDIHGDFNSLEHVIKTFEKQGIDSALFLGDAIHNVMSQMTVKKAQEAIEAKEKLTQDSPLRKAVLKGKYSDKQLERLVKNHYTATETSKKIAKADYKLMKEKLDQLKNYVVLGGNWDYRDEIRHTFMGHYLNAQSAEIEGITFTGFSGGGAPINVVMPEEVLADDQRNKRYQFRTWRPAFQDENIQNTDVFISHVPFTDGEGVEKENAVEHLKDMVLDFNSKRESKTPKVFISGHRHEPMVRYDKEINGFVINPGAAGTNHNKGIPTFMTAEFDGKTLSKIQKYEIRSSLEGLSNVVLTEEYTLDYDKKKVKTDKKQETVLSEADKEKFVGNLSLDDNKALMEKGVSIKYKGLSAEEKDELIRRNIAVMFDYLEEVEDTLKQTIMAGAFDSIKDDKVTKEAVKQIYHSLAEKAMKRFGASIDHVDEKDKDFYRNVLLDVAFGIRPGELHYQLSNEVECDAGKISSLGGDLIKSARNNVSRTYQNYFFKDLKAEDYQEIVDLYLPLDYERKADLTEHDAFQLWLKTYYNGILTSGNLSEYDYAYEHNKDFKGKELTRQDLEGMYGIEQKTPEQILEQLGIDPEEFKRQLVAGQRKEYTRPPNPQKRVRDKIAVDSS